MSEERELVKIAILGCQGYGAQYGGFETLTQNLVDCSDRRAGYQYIIYNSSDERSEFASPPATDEVRSSRFRANGFQGVFFDFFSTISALRECEILLFLGPFPLIFAPVLRILMGSQSKLVVNVGGLEWKRPNRSIFAKFLLWQAFKVACRRADYCIFDNQIFVDIAEKSKIKYRASSVIPYGCGIDQSRKVDDSLLQQFPFLDRDYCITVGRSVPDNNLKELLESFPEDCDLCLVVISNFSASDYGRGLIRASWGGNVFCIDGCYHKPTLDLLRRGALLYIHTHQNCGTAPSLIEGAIACERVCSLDVPQNRYSLNQQGFYFSNFFELREYLKSGEYASASVDISKIQFTWKNIVSSYEDIWTIM